MYGFNSEILFGDKFTYIIRNGKIIKHTKDLMPIESKTFQSGLIRFYNNVYYHYDTNLKEITDLEKFYEKIDFYDQTDPVTTENPIIIDECITTYHKNSKIHTNQGVSEEYNNIEDITSYKVDIGLQDFYYYQNNLFLLFKHTVKQYAFSGNFFYYALADKIYVLDLQTKDIRILCEDASVDYLFVDEDLLVYANKSGKLYIYTDLHKCINKIINIQDFRTLHKHDTSISRILRVNNILYIITSNNKFSALELNRDKIYYKFEFLSPNVSMIKNNSNIFILNHIEIIKYDLITSEYEVKYNIPNAKELFLLDIQGKGEESYMKVSPEYYCEGNDKYMLRYRNMIIFLGTKEIVDEVKRVRLHTDDYKEKDGYLDINSIYRIPNESVFYHKGYIFVDDTEYIHIYTKKDKDLYYVTKIESVPNISRVCYINDTYYIVAKDNFTSKYKVYQKNLINICVVQDIERYKVIKEEIYYVRDNIIYNINHEVILKRKAFDDFFVSKDRIYILEKHKFGSDVSVYTKGKYTVEDTAENKLEVYKYRKQYFCMKIINNLIYLWVDNHLDVYDGDTPINEYKFEDKIYSVIGENILLDNFYEIKNYKK